jgi:hypothetical protein
MQARVTLISQGQERMVWKIRFRKVRKTEMADAADRDLGRTISTVEGGIKHHIISEQDDPHVRPR